MSSLISVNSRDDQLHNVVEPLLAAHHHDQLDAQLKEASAGVTIISAVALKRNKNEVGYYCETSQILHFDLLTDK